MKSNSFRYAFIAAAMVVAFVAGNVLVKWLQKEPAEESGRVVALKYRPEFKLPDLEGKMRNVNEWNGKLLVVNFWAPWCPPCQKEMPSFVELQDKYGSKGVQFVGIALDKKQKVQDFVDTVGAEYPNLLGGDQASKTSLAYGNILGALPYTTVINRKGYIIRSYQGAVSKKSLEKLIIKNM